MAFFATDTHPLRPPIFFLSDHESAFLRISLQTWPRTRWRKAKCCTGTATKRLVLDGPWARKHATQELFIYLFMLFSDVPTSPLSHHVSHAGVLGRNEAAPVLQTNALRDLVVRKAITSGCGTH